MISYGDIQEALRQLSKTTIIVLSLIMIAGIGVLDWLTGTGISTGLFYAVPIAMCAWYVGLTAGLFASLLSTSAMIMADSYVGRMTIMEWWDTIVHLGLFIFITIPIFKLRLAYDRERLLSRTDPLTGVFNKRAFMEYARLEIERSRRFGHRFSVAYIDLDNFKQVNDTYGHATGDKLLKDLVGIIKDNTRIVDVVSRLGGDEFAIILPETEEGACNTIFLRVSEVFGKLMDSSGYRCSISVGLLTYTTPPPSAEEMLSKVDALMYQAKNSGKNTICRAVEQSGVRNPL